MSDDRKRVALPPGRLEPLDLDLKNTGLSRSVGASIGKKYLMAWAGLLWIGFVLVHLMGNFGIFLGQDAFNGYAAKLMSLGPYLIIMEAGLVIFLLTHVVFGVWVTLENAGARPESYAVYRSKGGRTVASRTMIWTGLAILVFIVLHLINLKFGEHATVRTAEGERVLDLYSATIDLLSQPLHGIGYIIAVILVGVHVRHALQSSLRTIGLNHDKYTPRIAVLSIGLGVFIAVGYASLPVWILLGGGQ